MQVIENVKAKKLMMGFVQLICDNCHRRALYKLFLDLNGKAMEQKFVCIYCDHECRPDDETKRVFEQEYERFNKRSKSFWLRVTYALSLLLFALPMLITAIGPVVYILIYKPSLSGLSFVLIIFLWFSVLRVSIKLIRLPVHFFDHVHK